MISCVKNLLRCENADFLANFVIAYSGLLREFAGPGPKLYLGPL